MDDNRKPLPKKELYKKVKELFSHDDLTAFCVLGQHYEDILDELEDFKECFQELNQQEI